MHCGAEFGVVVFHAKLLAFFLVGRYLDMCIFQPIHAISGEEASGYIPSVLRSCPNTELGLRVTSQCRDTGNIDSPNRVATACRSGF